MSRMRATVKDYAELGRVSNLPTCVTNVLVGCAVGAGAASMPAWTVLAAIGGVGLLYVGGMALNDAVDAKIDRQERPNRPIPSGRISRRAAYAFAVANAAIGMTSSGHTLAAAATRYTSPRHAPINTTVAACFL